MIQTGGCRECCQPLDAYEDLQEALKDRTLFLFRAKQAEAKLESLAKMFVPSFPGAIITVEKVARLIQNEIDSIKNISSENNP